MFNGVRVVRQMLTSKIVSSNIPRERQLQSRSHGILSCPLVGSSTTRNFRIFQPCSKAFLPFKTPPARSIYAQQTKDTQNPESQPTTTTQPIKFKDHHLDIVQQNVKVFVFMRYMDYLKNYQMILKNSFQAIFNLYRTFMDGIKDFCHDMKWYLKVWQIVHDSPKGIRSLNLKELELYMKMPRDMVKVAPTIIGSSLPIIGYAFFTLAFIYPRHLLSSHFWTLPQRDQFQQEELKKRLSNYKPLVRRLYGLLKTVKEPLEYCELARILAVVGHASFCLTPEEILSMDDFFAKSPYSLKSLSKRHINLLLDMYGLPRFTSKRRLKLQTHALLIQQMDRAICGEGGVHILSLEALEKACALRGFNPVGMSYLDKIYWLRKWIYVSTALDDQHVGLLLHLPILLACTHPSKCQSCTHFKNTRKSKTKWVKAR